MKYECYEDFDKTIPSNTLSADGKYTPTIDGASRYVWFTITAGDYYYVSGVYHPKTTAGASTGIMKTEKGKSWDIDAAKTYNLTGQLVGESCKGIVIANGDKILRK